MFGPYANFYVSILGILRLGYKISTYIKYYLLPTIFYAHIVIICLLYCR